MPRALVFFFAGLASSLIHAAPNPQVVCSYAPSQSKVVAGIAGGGGGLAAATAAIAKATGLVAVTHSSGAAILTGSSGYIAGTLGGASAAPFILGVGLLVGGAAVTV